MGERVGGSEEAKGGRTEGDWHVERSGTRKGGRMERRKGTRKRWIEGRTQERGK
jgi:hypothetical protein